MQFNKITPEDDAYSVIDQALNDSSDDRTDYNDVAKAYNDLKAGEAASFEFPKSKFPSLKKQLEKRELIVGVDMQIKHVLDGADDEGNGGTETVILRRLTTKPAKILVITVPNRKKKGTAAAAAAPAAPAVEPSTDAGDGAAASENAAPAAAEPPKAAAGKANPPKAAGKK